MGEINNKCKLLKGCDINERICKLEKELAVLTGIKYKSIVGIWDRGTSGLTGYVPKTAVDATRIIPDKKIHKDKKKLATFLSSNWSQKEKGELG